MNGCSARNAYRKPSEGRDLLGDRKQTGLFAVMSGKIVSAFQLRPNQSFDGCVVIAIQRIKSEIGIRLMPHNLNHYSYDYVPTSDKKMDGTVVWCAPAPMETRIFSEAMQIADRMAKACNSTATPSCGSTKSWVVEIAGDTGKIFYRSPVALA